MDNKDYYRVLGVEKSADEREIKRAYRNPGGSSYPDKAPGHHQNPGTSKQQPVFNLTTLLFGGFHDIPKKD